MVKSYLFYEEQPCSHPVEGFQLKNLSSSHFFDAALSPPRQLAEMRPVFYLRYSSSRAK